MNEDGAQVVAVAADGEHRFSKPLRDRINLVAGLGVRGDAHAGVTVKHRSRVARDPTAPNLRQVHLIHAELFDELRAKGFAVAAGDLGENIVTQGLALLDLPVGTLLTIGEAKLRLTGLRNPCAQIDGLGRGLMAAVLGRDADGGLVRQAGVMALWHPAWRSRWSARPRPGYRFPWYDAPVLALGTTGGDRGGDRPRSVRK